MIYDMNGQHYKIILWITVPRKMHVLRFLFYLKYFQIFGCNMTRDAYETESVLLQII